MFCADDSTKKCSVCGRFTSKLTECSCCARLLCAAHCSRESFVCEYRFNGCHLIETLVTDSKARDCALDVCRSKAEESKQQPLCRQAFLLPVCPSHTKQTLQILVRRSGDPFAELPSLCMICGRILCVRHGIRCTSCNHWVCKRPHGKPSPSISLGPLVDNLVLPLGLEAPDEASTDLMIPQPEMCIYCIQQAYQLVCGYLCSNVANIVKQMLNAHTTSHPAQTRWRRETGSLTHLAREF